MVKERPLLFLTLAVLFGPTLFWVTLLVGPWLLLLDALLQKAYAWKGPALENALDTTAQAVWLWLLAVRLGIRHFGRFLQREAERLLEGRSLGDICRQWWRDPITTSQALLEIAAGAVRWLCAKVPQWFALLPRLSSLVSASPPTAARAS